MSAAGKWKVTIQTPMGAQEATLDLAIAGSALTGKMEGRQGNTDISDGTANGNDLGWKTNINGPMGPMTLTFAAKVDGDKIGGTVQLGAFGSANFSGARA